jgi:heme/copper-type cytochrome/quinol oxidase subunit 2
MQPETSHAPFFHRSILIVAIAIVIAIGAIVGAVAYLASNGSSGTTESSPCSVLSTNTSQNAPGTSNSSSTSSMADFTILESDPGTNYEGMNGSAFHLSGNESIPWPEIQVYQGQTVVIHVFNCASSEPHGFAVSHYFDSGATVRPGTSFTLTFVATEAGTFRVYCSIFCAIHPYMQNGELIVTPT